MKKIVAIAVRHPDLPNLFLHGLRRDNHKWALAGGHAKAGEIDDEAASRELEEETGLKGVKLDHIHENTYGQANVHLFSCEMPEGVELNASEDPDSEFVTFKFLDPTSHENLHIPAERNILVEWMKHSLKKPEPIAKMTPKIKVEPFIADPENFNPRKHDFIVKAYHKGKPVGMMAVTHTPSGGLMPFNFEVHRFHRRKGIGTSMAKHAQKISGKKIVRSPDMTQDAVHWANSFIKPMAKAEAAGLDLVLAYPVTIAGKRHGGDGVPYQIVVKNFGPIMENEHPDVDGIVSAHDLKTPLNPAKLTFVPHKLAGLKGIQHAVAVHGIPEKIAHLRAATSSIGPSSSSHDPYIQVDENTFNRLKSMGHAVTAEEAGIIIHPAELRHGDVVLKTY